MRPLFIVPRARLNEKVVNNSQFDPSNCPAIAKELKVNTKLLISIEKIFYWSQVKEYPEELEPYFAASPSANINSTIFLHLCKKVVIPTLRSWVRIAIIEQQIKNFVTNYRESQKK